MKEPFVELVVFVIVVWLGVVTVCVMTYLIVAMMGPKRVSCLTLSCFVGLVCI